MKDIDVCIATHMKDEFSVSDSCNMMQGKCDNPENIATNYYVELLCYKQFL